MLSIDVEMWQFLDTEDEDGDGRSGFEEWQAALGIPPEAHWGREYTLLFSVTMQVPLHTCWC